MRTMVLRTDKTTALVYGPRLNQLGERMHYETYDPLGSLAQIGSYSTLNMKLEIQNGRSKLDMGMVQGMSTTTEQEDTTPEHVMDEPLQATVATDTPVQLHDHTVEIQDDPLSGIEYITLETK